jgi:localization factor PodJL
MKQGIPWSVKGVKPEARGAAKDAAHRAGMTLGEWLNRVIADTASASGTGDSGGQGASAALPPQLERAVARAVTDVMSGTKAESSTLQALDAVARWIETTDTRRREDTQALVSTQERSTTVLRDAIDRVSRKVDSIERSVETTAAPIPPIKATLEKIEDRLSGAVPPPATVRIESTLKDLESRFNALARTLLAESPSAGDPPVPPMAPAATPILEPPALGEPPLPPRERLARAVEAIRARQNDLDAGTTDASSAALRGEIRSLSERVDAIARRTGPEAGAELRSMLGDIRSALAEADPSPRLDSFGRRLDAVTERLDSMAGLLAPLDGLDGLRREIAELRDSVSAKSDQKPLSVIKDAVAALGARLDAQPAAAFDAAGLDELRHGMSELREAVASSVPAALVERLGRLEEGVAGIASQAGPIEPRRFDALEARVQDLLQKLDDARPQPSPDMAGLKAQIAELTLRLDKVDLGFRGVSHLEQSIDDLSSRLDESRRSLAEAARLAAGEAVKALPAMDPSVVRRIDASLDGLHDTLARVLERLADQERVSVREIAAAAPPPAPTPAPAPVPVPEPAPKAAPQPSAAEKLAAATAAAEAARAAAAAAAESQKPSSTRRGVDPRQLVAAARAAAARSQSEPLELQPVMEAPRVAATIAVPAEDPEPAGDPVVADLVAKENGPSRIDALRSYAARRRRPLLIGLAAMFALLGVLHAIRGQFEGPQAEAPAVSGQAPASAPGAGAQPPATPEPESAAPGRNSSLTDPAPKAADPVAPAPAPSSPADPAKPLSQGSANAVFAPEPQYVGSLGTHPKPAEMTSATPTQPSASAQPFTEPLPAGLPPALAKALQAGDAIAAYELSARYAEGRGGLPKDPRLSAVWLEQSASRGFAPAQYRLGSLYERGLGVTRDPAAARRWYEQAADAGNVKAMHNLGVILAEASSGKPDYVAAAQWFRKAAEFGLRDSQYNLAILVGRGLGVSQNLPEAYLWFSLAAAQGDQDAAAKREEVASRLDPASLAAAKASVQAFRPKPAVTAANEVAPPAGLDAGVAGDARKDKAKPSGT